MQKRLLSVILSMSLVLSEVPTAALAEAIDDTSAEEVPQLVVEDNELTTDDTPEDVVGSEVTPEVTPEEVLPEEPPAEELTEEAARFFLDYHCRLTEKPGALQVIWPTYIEEQKLIKYNDNSVMIHVTGYPTTRVFPTATVRNYAAPNGRVFEAFLNERQQLISAGRTKALEYAYFWKEPLQQSEDEPQVNVVDAAGSSVIAGDTNELPGGKSLCITAPFDGNAEIRSQGRILDKRQLHAEQKCIIENITFGLEIRVYVGLDCVWKAAFNREQIGANKNEEVLLNRLRNAGGREIVIPHSIAGIASSIRSYPLLRQWLYGCIRKGTMPEKAYKLFRTAMNDMKQKG